MTFVTDGVHTATLESVERSATSQTCRRLNCVPLLNACLKIHCHYLICGLDRRECFPTSIGKDLMIPAETLIPTQTSDMNKKGEKNRVIDTCF